MALAPSSMLMGPSMRVCGAKICVKVMAGSFIQQVMCTKESGTTTKPMDRALSATLRAIAMKDRG